MIAQGFLSSNAEAGHIETFLVKLDGDGRYFSKHIYGNIFQDGNNDCILQNEIGVLGSIIEIQNANSTSYVIADEDGNYTIPLNAGNYTITPYPQNPYLASECQPAYDVVFTDPDVLDSIELNLPMATLVECPYMEVDVSSFALRDCFDNIYYVNYQNSGTATAEDVYVELTIAPPLILADAGLPFTGPDNNDVYTFQLGDIEPGETGNFQTILNLTCDTLEQETGLLTGNTYCVTAHIYPDSLCSPISPNWDGSSIKLNGFCEGDSITFTITNVGNGDMITPNDFYVIEDEIMIIQDMFQLESGQSQTVTVYAGGGTIRMEAEQSLDHPGESHPSVTLENCGETDEFSLGFFNNFHQDDANPFVSIECREVTGAYDPNDKLAFPGGNSEENLIEANRDIEYMIRFQNVGTDTAFNVVVKDTIADELDLTTFRAGASSHPNTITIEGRTVIFRFDNIHLVDSDTNEPLSHGFVKFRISQNPDLPEGTIIENDAAIYFDYNPPIYTNTTYHKIALFSFLVSQNNSLGDLNTLHAKVYPNPFKETINFECEGIEGKEITFRLTDVLGRIVAEEKHDSGTFQFRRKNLLAGIYFYTIETEQKPVFQGKIIVR